MNLTRRNLLRGLLAGSAFAGASLIGMRTPGRLVAPGARIARLPPAVGTYERLRHALIRNQPIVLGGSEAFADGPGPQPVIVHVKVMNQMHAPLVFAMGAVGEGGAVDRGDGSRAMASKAPQASAELAAAGIDKVHPDPRFGTALRFNQWFGDMLKTGMVNASSGNPQQIPASAGRTGEFPDATKVSIHNFVGIDSNVTHTYNNFLFSEAASSAVNAGGDLLFHAVTTGLVRPPLGITTFNMGGDKENTGGLDRNSVLNGARTVVSSGRSVTELTGVLQSAISTGLVDDQLVALFDAVGQTGFPDDKKSTLRDSLVANRAILSAKLQGLTQVAALEGMQQTVGVGNVQGNSDAVAGSEFISQCAWVVDALAIPGQPLRAFCLDVHVSDIDGQAFDTGNAPSAAGPGLSYVESMRQLAIGLNMLAKAIESYQHVYVLVSTEGGRDEGGGDSVAPSGILLAPGSGVAGGLQDFFYAPQGALDASDPQWLRDPSSMPRMWQPGSLVSFSGVVQADTTSNMDIMHGLLSHLATVTGVAPTTTSAFGNRVKLRGSV